MESWLKRDLPSLKELKLRPHALQGNEDNQLSEFTPTHYKNTLLMRGLDGGLFLTQTCRVCRSCFVSMASSSILDRLCCGVVLDGWFHVDVPNLSVDGISCNDDDYFNLFSLQATSRNEEWV